MAKILVVEDEAPLLKVLADKFIQEGEEVETAKDGEEGLRAALSTHPDIILLDIKMPKMSGLEMLELLRKDAWGAEVPVLVLSNMNDSASISESMHNKITKYYVKSDWKLDDVVSEVNGMLEYVQKNKN